MGVGGPKGNAKRRGRGRDKDRIWKGILEYCQIELVMRDEKSEIYEDLKSFTDISEHRSYEASKREQTPGDYKKIAIDPPRRKTTHLSDR